MELLVDDVTKVDPIGSQLISTLLYENFDSNTILHYHGMEAAEDGKYYTLSAINSSKGLDYITPEKLINKLHIGLKTTLKSTTYQFIS